MNTIVVVLVFLTSVAAKDYSACLVLHDAAGEYAGSIIFRQADKYDYVVIDQRLNSWPAGEYHAIILLDRNPRDCHRPQQLAKNPNNPEWQWTIFDVEFVNNKSVILDWEPAQPRSLDPIQPHSIINRSVAMRLHGVGVRDTNAYACGRIFQTKNKYEKCDETNSMTTVLTKSTTKPTTTTSRTKRTTTSRTKRPSVTTTKAPVPAEDHRRR